MTSGACAPRGAGGVAASSLNAPSSVTNIESCPARLGSSSMRSFVDRPRWSATAVRSVGALIRSENERRISTPNHDELRPIHLDLDLELTLRNAGHTLGSILAPGERVTIKTAVSDNARAENSTAHGLSPALIADAARAARAAHVRFAGIDLVTPDPSVSLTEAGGAVLEVNSPPGLHYHYLVEDTAAATRVAVPVLECLLADTRGGALALPQQAFEDGNGNLADAAGILHPVVVVQPRRRVDLEHHTTRVRQRNAGVRRDHVDPREPKPRGRAAQAPSSTSARGRSRDDVLSGTVVTDAALHGDRFARLEDRGQVATGTAKRQLEVEIETQRPRDFGRPGLGSPSVLRATSPAIDVTPSPRSTGLRRSTASSSTPSR